MADLPEVIEQNEDALLEQELHKLDRFPKLRAWLQLFLDKTNKQTYGNRTQSAMVAYNLDPVTQLNTAGVIGYQNYKKLHTVASLYYDQIGMTTTKILDLIAAHAASKGGKALELLAGVTGVYDSKAQVLIQTNIQNNNTTVTMDDPNIKTFQQDFAEFLEGKYNAKK